jgi:predicted ATP-dependent Lon-type protease
MKKKDSNNLDNFIEEAIGNIRDDRATTSALLTGLMKHMKVQGEHSHESLGAVAAKYLETLQRSNEQLVKLTSLMQKDKQNSKEEINPEDMFEALEEMRKKDE